VLESNLIKEILKGLKELRDAGFEKCNPDCQECIEIQEENADDLDKLIYQYEEFLKKGGVK
jgi:hypothetical protein